MTTDVVLSRELKSLRDEVSASQKERAAAPATPAAPTTPGPVSVGETQEQQELSDQLRQFADEVSNFFGEAEKGIAAHPTQSVVGAMLVGIMIGWMLGKR